MQALVFLLFVAVINVGVCQPPTCDEGWHSFLGKCYRYGDTTVPWGEAQAMCRPQGSLVEIPTHEVDDFLAEIALGYNNECVWVGGSDIFHEGDFKWASGDNFTFTNWEDNQPSSGSGRYDEDCICLMKQFNYKWNDGSCEYKCNFICEKPAVRNRTGAAWGITQTEENPATEKGWQYFRGHYYRYGGTAVPWGEAQAICRPQGSLAEIPTPEVNFFLTEIARRYNNECVWVGGSDIFREGDFKWASGGHAFTFTNWDSSQPSSGLGYYDEDCICLMKQFDYKWNDGTCDYSCNFICEKPEARSRTEEDLVITQTEGNPATEEGECQPPTCDDGGQYFRGHCYHYGDTTVSWGEAQAICRPHGLLVEIQTLEVNDFLAQLVLGYNNKCVWVGGNDIFHEGDFKWASGRHAFNFTYWNRKEPSSGSGRYDEDCISLMKQFNYKWNDGSCDYKCNFICEKPLSRSRSKAAQTEITQTEKKPATEGGVCQQPTCDEDWHFVLGKCYRYGHLAVPWLEAQTKCGPWGSLAEVPTSQVNYFLTDVSRYFNDSCVWLGGSDIAQEGFWEWPNRHYNFNDRTRFTNWNSREPSNDSDEDCLAMVRRFNYKWNDGVCNYRCNFICEQPEGLSPTDAGLYQLPTCHRYWQPQLSRCYGETTVNWMDARGFCRSRGARLLEIRTREINDFMKRIARYMADPCVWLGGNDLYEEGVWKWASKRTDIISNFTASGDFHRFTNWATGEPNNRGDCLQMLQRYNYRWDDTDCAKHCHFICELV